MSRKQILRGPPIESTLKDTSLGEFFFEYADKYSDRICQIDGSTGRTETYKSEQTRAIRVALNLKRLGLQQDHVVAFCCNITFDSITPVLATIYLGVKFAVLHPKLSCKEITRLLDVVNPQLIIADEESVDLIERSTEAMVPRPEIIVLGQSDKYRTFKQLCQPPFDKDEEDEFYPARVDPMSTILILFSSGTTSLPKGICHSHRALLQGSSQFWDMGYRSEVLLFTSNLYWFSGLWMLVFNYRCGGTRTYADPVTPANLLKVIDRYKATFMMCTPGLLCDFLEEDIEGYDLRSIDKILVGGSPMSLRVARDLGDKFRAIGVDGLFLAPGYGTSETGLISMCQAKDLAQLSLVTQLKNFNGQVGCGVTLKIVSLESGMTLGPNQKGEIMVRCPDTVLNGYYKGDHLSSFDHEGFFKTGDIGYFDDNDNIFVIDRIKEVFKYNGFQVVPSVVEAVVLQHPDVAEAVVFGIADEKVTGSKPAAWVVLRHGKSGTTEDEIREFVDRRVEDHQRLRGGVRIVEEIPKTPSGKVSRNAIRQLIHG